MTSANRDSPSSAQTPAAGHDTSGNKTTSTVREQSNVTASIRTANSAQHSLSGNASQHEPAGRSPAPMSTRMTQANMQGVRSKVNDRSAQRPEQTENAAAQSIDHAVPAVAQRPSPGSAGISSSPAVSGQHSSQPFGMGTRYTQRPSARGVSEQKPKAIRPGHAGTSPTRPAPSSTVQVDEQRILPHLLKGLSPVHGLTGISHRVVMFLLIKHEKPITTRPGRKRDRLGFEMSLRQKECFPLSAPTPQEIERMSLKGR